MISVFKATIYNFQSNAHFEGILDKMQDIAVKDKTFSFTFDNRNLEIYLQDEDKDRLIKRCDWIVHKADDLKKIVFRWVKL